MTPNDDKISNIQLCVLVFNIVLGIGILTLPASLTKAAENDGWILCIISGLLCILSIYFMCYVGNKYAEYGLVGTLKKLFGGFVGTALAIPIILYYIFFCSVEVRLFAETAKLYLLPNTSLEIIILPLIILAVLLSRTGIESIARFFESITPFIFFLIFVLITVTIPKSDYSNIRPFLGTPLTKLIKGISVSIFSYAGFEILLLIFPYLRTPKKAFKFSSAGLIIIIVFYVFADIQCLAKFGVKETESFIYPTISLIRASQVPGGFIERLEGLLLALWVTSVFTTLVGLLFSLSVVLSDVLKHKKPKHIVSMFIPIIYIVALWGDSVAELFELSDKLMNTLGLYSIGILPLLMFLFSLFRKRDVKKSEG
ncbi:spore germination protein [Caloramator quimbayensis]|uniref:Spore germination protein n=1 Tax=Caloramator quimbayensis TaxID=1147123 RepID=A0A1T4WGC5_9CLOT|nr:endospore germination permease [Caloramator quimbayensis]SKA76257.1 spore germination protein [Caloramator quimbayensis]